MASVSAPSVPVDIHDPTNPDRIKNRIHTKIYKCIPEELIPNIEYLEYKKKFCGIDYIDGIKAEDVSAPLSYMIDDHYDDRKDWRFCLVIKYKLPNGDEVVETLFQRYSRNRFNWAIGTCYDGSVLRGMSSGYVIENNVFFGDRFNYKVLDVFQQICENGFEYHPPSDETSDE